MDRLAEGDHDPGELNCILVVFREIFFQEKNWAFGVYPGVKLIGDF
jgi:hypothetical protein